MLFDANALLRAPKKRARLAAVVAAKGTGTGGGQAG